MVTKTQIMLEARSWVDTPFLHQGRIKGVAVDCIGVPICVGKELNFIAYDEIPYGTLPDGRRLVVEVEKRMDRVPRPWPENIEIGDLVLIAWRRYPIHAAIVGEVDGDLTLIHALRDNGKVVEHRLDDEWLYLVKRVYRYPGVEPCN